ncbi:MAG: M12 family metallo-peptidase [Balneolaceae bacterium]
MHISKYFGALSFILLFPLLVFSQGETFQFNSLDDSGVKTKQTPAGEEQERLYYDLNSDLFEGETVLSAGDILQVELEPGNRAELIIQRVESYFAETVSVRAADINNRENVFSFTYQNGRVNGLYHVSHSSTVYFEHEPDTGENYLSETSFSGDDVQLCSVHEEHGQVPKPSTSPRQKTKDGYPLNPPNIAAMGGESLDDIITIDLMIVYTQKAQDYAESSTFGSIEAMISQAMNLSQQGLDNSGVNINLRLVHTHKTDYDDDGTEEVEGGDHLRRLTQGAENGTDFNTDEDNYDGYMEDVHTLREEYGADVVAMIASEPNTGGIAWLNNSTAGRDDLAFSVNRAEQVGRTFTLIHEIGHNMGNAHARNQEEAPAGAIGGLFKYSAGYLSPEGYNTIMAYGELPVPYFSSPDLVDPDTGVRLGSDRANSILTMRQIKRSIASYRLSHTDPPVAAIVDNAINIALTDNNSRVTVPVAVNNNGDSDLMWSIDFDLTSTSAEPAARSKGISFDRVIEPHPFNEPFLAENEFGWPDEDGVIFETGFEPSDGFTPLGVTDTLGGWRVLIDDMEFDASDANPSGGLQHLRLQSSSQSDETQIATSPYFGPQPFGEFEVSMDVAINQASGTDKERFDIYIFDGDREELSSGVVFESHPDTNANLMFAYGRNPQSGTDSFFGTQFNYPGNNVYFNLRIVYNASAASLDYYVDDQLVASNVYTEGKKPDYIWFLNFNDQANGSIDIDNVEVIRNAAPLSWLEVDRFSGVTGPGEQDELLLTFTAEGVENGIYETELIVTSNDPDAPAERIPIAVNIDLDQPIGQPQPPDEIALEQNFPNPFNPVTTINYDLDDTYPISLEVYDITGKKIATLVNRQQAAGSYAVSFDGQGLSSGVYIYRLQTPTEILTRKMVLVK